MEKPDISLNIYHARVVAGAYWLDAKLPGWENKISLQLLNMRSCTECVLGQIWGSYSNCVESLLMDVPDQPMARMARVVALTETWGFNLMQSDAYTPTAHEWAMLQEAWIYEILRRKD